MFEVWYHDNECDELEAIFNTREEAEEFAAYMNRTEILDEEEQEFDVVEV